MLSLRTVVSNPRQALLGQSLIYINLNEGTAPPHFPNAYGMAVKLLWVILMTRYFPRFLLKTMSRGRPIVIPSRFSCRASSHAALERPSGVKSHVLAGSILIPKLPDCGLSTTKAYLSQASVWIVTAGISQNNLI